MEVNEHVLVRLADGFTFVGTIRAIRNTELIVKADDASVIEDRRNQNLDPPGCLVIHQSFVRALK